MGKNKIVAATKIQAKTYEMKIEALRARAKKIRFDLAIQRNFVWDDQRKSDLLYSILYGYPIPPVFSRVIDSEDKVEADSDWMLDGKQRLTTILSYVMDGDTVKGDDGKAIVERDKDGNPIMDTVTKKPLLKKYVGWTLENLPPLTFINQETGEEFEEDVNGKTFENLPEHVQDLILGSPIQVTRIKNMTDDEQDVFFRLTNQGMPLKPIELVRALAGSIVMSFVKNIVQRPFFANTVAISLDDKRQGREELVTQIIMLVHATMNKLDVPTIGGKALKEFATVLNEKGLDENIKTVIEQTTDYLSQALPNRESKLTKVHAHALFLVAIQAMQNGVPASKFGGYVQDFLANRVKGRYKWATESGTAKKEKVEVRLSEVIKDYETHITNAPEYVSPVPATRGRKPKAQDQGDTTPPVNQGEGETQNQNDPKLVGVGASVEG